MWLCAGDTHTAAKLVGLTDVQRAGGTADPDVVQGWLDDGAAPNGVCGRAFGRRGVHGFDLTFCAPKSVSLIRAIRAGEVADKAITAAHATAISEAMEYLAVHAGYTRVHNLVTGNKDLVRLPGVVAIGYQHETSRAGDPHLHTHVIVPNRQARTDGQLVSIDGTSLYHEAKAAGVIYQATLRRELHQSLGCEWLPVDPATGMAEVAGIAPESVTAWSQRSTQLRQWAAGNLTLAEEDKVTPAQLGAAQKATRPAKSEQLCFAELRAAWRADERGPRISTWSWSTKPPWSAPTICVDCSPPQRKPKPRPCSSVMPTSWPRSGPAAGMFAQLRADLPWAQELCELWRMRDAEERIASLALRDGGPAPVRRAVEWYALTTGCTPVMPSPWPPTRWPPTTATPPPAKTRC